MSVSLLQISKYLVDAFIRYRPNCSIPFYYNSNTQVVFFYLVVLPITKREQTFRTKTIEKNEGTFHTLPQEII